MSKQFDVLLSPSMPKFIDIGGKKYDTSTNPVILGSFYGVQLLHDKHNYADRAQFRLIYGGPEWWWSHSANPTYSGWIPEIISLLQQTQSYMQENLEPLESASEGIPGGFKFE